MGLLDPRFRYVPAAATDVTSTWRRFGFKPTTETERRQRRQHDEPRSALPAELAPRVRRRRVPTLKLAVGE